MSTGFKKITTELKHPNIIMSLWQNNSNAWLCLYPNNSRIQQPDSQVNNCSMCPPWAWTTAFNRGRHWSTAWLMSCWSRLAQHCRCTFCPWDHPNPWLVAQNCGIFLSTFQYLWDFCWTQGCLPHCISVQLHARYSVPFWRSLAVRYRPSERLSSLCQSCAEDL